MDESKYRELYTRQLSSIKEKEDKIELKKKEFLAEEQKKLQEFARKQREHILRRYTLTYSLTYFLTHLLTHSLTHLQYAREA